MTKVFSARLDEDAIAQMEILTRRRRMTKKRFLEEAIRRYAAELTSEEEQDIWSATFGAWKRRSSAKRTVQDIRGTFGRNFTRHRRS